jgi:hypothetical protein
MPPFWEISDYEVPTHESHRDLHSKKRKIRRRRRRRMRQREGQEF